MPASSTYSFQTDAQRRLYQQLSTVLGHGPAAFYYDIVRLLLETSPYQSTTYLIEHLIREIESALRQALLPYNYTSSQEEEHKKQIETICGMYAIDTETCTQWVNIVSRLQENFYDVVTHTYTLDTLYTSDTNIDEYAYIVTPLEHLLIKIFGAFERQSIHIYYFMAGLLLTNQPKESDALQFKNTIPANWVTYAYFFSRLQNPIWLRLLSAQNIFAMSSKSMPNTYFHYDPWPQATYLKKMSTQERVIQKQVAEILKTVTHTTNPLTQQAILEIVQLLPLDLSIELQTSNIPF